MNITITIVAVFAVCFFVLTIVVVIQFTICRPYGKAKQTTSFVANTHNVL